MNQSYHYGAPRWRASARSTLTGLPAMPGLGLMMLCALAAPATQAQAQAQTQAQAQAQAQGGAPGQDAITLPTVEITATAARPNGLLDLDTTAAIGSRLALTPRETPASVSVVERAAIDERGGQNTQEVLRGIAGISAHDAPGSVGVSYRGFGGGSVSQLFNGISLQYAIAARPVDSWIYERVEAIGGPSSFLYGAGAVGGSINYITKLAERREFGEAQVRIGTDGLKEGAFGINRRVGGVGGVGENTHYARLDVNHRDADSPIEGSGRRSAQLAASLRSDLGAQLTHTLAYEYQDEDVQRPYWGTPLVGPAVGTARIDPGTRTKNYNSADGIYAQRVHWLRSVTEWRRGADLQLSNTAYAYDALRDYRNVESYRFNPGNTAVIRSAALLQRHDQRVVGNSIDGVYRGRLAGRRSDWAAGLDISVNRQTRFPNSLPAVVSTVDPYDFATERFFDIAGMTPGYRPDRDNKVGTVALYLENRTELAPTLHLVGAARHERIELNLTNRREVTAANPASFERRYRPSTGRIGLVWDVTPGASAYAQYASAADPPSGVLSTASFADVRTNSALTTGRQAEVGFKSGFWAGKGSATVAAYRISRRNIATQDPDNSAVTLLVGEQSARGLELALGLQPTRQLAIQGNLSYVKAEYDNFRQGGLSLAGRTPVNTPRRIANLWISHELTPSLKATLGARHVDRVFGDAANSIAWPSYTLFDVGLRYQLARAVSLTGRVRNAGDRVHALNLTGTMAYLGAARSADVSLHFAY